MLKICEVKVPLTFSENDIKNAICDYLHIKNDEILGYEILKKSIDARRKNNICYRCNFSVQLKGHYHGGATVEKYCRPDKRIRQSAKGLEVVVVGSGPAGLFSALELLESGVKVTILERGKRVEERIEIAKNILAGGEVNPSCNIQFGEGGAGTFSDGKLNSGINSPLVREVLQTFYENGAPADILYDSHPHVGTDLLQKVIKNIREKILSLGGKIIFDAKFVGFEGKNAKMQINYEKNDKNYKLVCDKLILAIGYSARDTHKYLFSKGLGYNPKPFSLGYRIEHLQKDIDNMLYGKFAPLLPPAPYKFAVHVDQRVVYTFCNCPGGVVVPAMSDVDQIVVNGMSYHARDGVNGNSALLVSVDTSDFGSDDGLAGMYLQERLEKEAYKKGNGKFIVTRLEDFMSGRPSVSLGRVKPTIAGYVVGDVAKLLPEKFVKTIRKGVLAIDKLQPGFYQKDAILTGIETRSSAPFMVFRDGDLMTNLKNVYSVGEGAGRAGGIVSAAVDGMKIAIKIVEGENGSN